MIIKVVRKIIWFVPVKVDKLNNAIEKALNIPEKVESSYIYMTKLFGAMIGTVGVARGMVDTLEAIACQDHICATISVVGVVADSIQIIRTWCPGANVTTLICMPISSGCKAFVYFCKMSKLPWRSCK